MLFLYFHNLHNYIGLWTDNDLEATWVVIYLMSESLYIGNFYYSNIPTGDSLFFIALNKYFL